MTLLVRSDIAKIDTSPWTGHLLWSVGKVYAAEVTTSSCTSRRLRNTTGTTHRHHLTSATFAAIPRVHRARFVRVNDRVGGHRSHVHYRETHQPL